MGKAGLIANLRVSKLLFSDGVTSCRPINAPEQRYPTPWQSVFVRQLQRDVIARHLP